MRQAIIVSQKVTYVTSHHLCYSMCSRCCLQHEHKMRRRWRHSPTACSI